MADVTLTGREVDDGRKDAIIAINGVKVFVLTQEGMALIGATYEQGKQVIEQMAELLRMALVLTIKKDAENAEAESTPIRSKP